VADVLIVSPHLDDAALSCWSVLARPGGPAGSVTVLDVCAGLPPAGVLGEWDARGGATSSRARVEQRRAEEAAVLAGTGARIVLLDLLDWQYGPQGEDVAAALAPHLAGAGWVLAPAGIGGHRDHLRVREAVLALHPEAVLYADLPYALRHGFEPSLPAYEPEERVLASHEAAAKVAALALYATQLPLLEADYGPLLDPCALAREVFFHRV
jgi:LmbE family N-acetylglucosaminyl deacetylase